MPAMALDVSIFLSGLQILGELGGTEIKSNPDLIMIDLELNIGYSRYT
jgi:hypothetical protein